MTKEEIKNLIGEYDMFVNTFRYAKFVVEGNAKKVRDLLEEFLQSAQPDLIAKIQNGIKVTDTNDAYSCGMRNGMRWCLSLIDGKEPLYENCQPAQPEIIRCRDCKWKQGAECVRFAEVRPFPNDFCSRAERRET